MVRQRHGDQRPLALPAGELVRIGIGDPFGLRDADLPEPVEHLATDGPAVLLVVQGDDDDVVDPQAVFSWVEAMPDKPALVRMPEPVEWDEAAEEAAEAARVAAARGSQGGAVPTAH